MGHFWSQLQTGRNPLQAEHLTHVWTRWSKLIRQTRWWTVANATSCKRGWWEPWDWIKGEKLWDVKRKQWAERSLTVLSSWTVELGDDFLWVCSSEQPISHYTSLIFFSSKILISASLNPSVIIWHFSRSYSVVRHRWGALCLSIHSQFFL